MSVAQAHTAAELRAARQELLEGGRSLRALATRQRRVRGAIERSWRRSVLTAAPSAPARYVGECDEAEPLLRAALPVLDHWRPSLEDSQAALFLSDCAGRVIAREVDDHGHARRLDRASAAAGFDFSEESYGTNGLGTAMEERSPVLVRGAEHFNDALQALACAGAPILDLSTGRVLGSLAIAVPASTTTKMLLVFARQAAHQIEQEYLDNTMPAHLRMVLSLMLRNPVQRPTLVISREGVFSSVGGLPLVSPENHVLLWEELQTRDWSLGSHPVTVAGRTGMARQLGDQRGSHAYVIEFEEPAPAAPAEVEGHLLELEGGSGTGQDHTPGQDLVPVLAVPLADDPERIVALIQEFRAERGVTLSAAAVQAFLRWRWPGDVAEMTGLLNRLAREFPRATVPLAALPEAMRFRGMPPSGIAAAELRAIETALRQAKGNRTKAAESLGIGRTTLWRKMRSYGIDERQYLAD